MRLLPIEKIRPCKDQPRRVFEPEALQSLAHSIKTQGILQPIIVRTLQDGYFELVVGERRWRAAQLAQLTALPALVREQLDEKTAAVLALIENIQREDLNVVEQACALERLAKEFHMTHEQLAYATGTSRSAITNLLRLLKLHPDVQALLLANKITFGHAKLLLSQKGQAQIALADHIIKQALSVREVERWLQSKKKNIPPKKSISADPDVMQLQAELSERLGTKISLQHTTHGHGRLIIYYANSEILEGILEKL